jgi:hypothetical protein
MGKPPGQCEGPYRSPNLDHEQDMAAHGASPTLAKWIFIAAAAMCVVLFFLLVVALHVPSGENP